MPNGLTVELVQPKVSWRLQSRWEVEMENPIFFRSLKEQVGPEMANEWIKGYLDGVESEIRDLGGAGQLVTEKVDMIRVEGGLTFWPYLNRHKSIQNPMDPMNVIFWRHGAMPYITDLLDNTVGGWANTVGVALYALIDDTLHGGSIIWKKFDEQRRKGPFLSRSSHIRLYSGTCVCNHGKGIYALGGVHEERFRRIPPIHVPISWDNARDDLEVDVQSVPGHVANVTRVRLVPKGTLQNIPYDGEASYIELAQPSWVTTAMTTVP